MTTATSNPLARAVRTCQAGFWAVGAFSFVINALILVVPLYTLQLFDRVLSSRSVDTLYMLTMAAIGLLLIQALLDGVRSRILVRLGLKLETNLSGPALAATIDAAARTGRPSAQSLRDVSEVRQVLASPSLYALFDAPWAPVFLVVLFLLHPMVGAVALVGTVVLVGLAALNILVTTRTHAAANSAAIGAFENVQSYVRNAHAIRAMGMRTSLVGRWMQEMTRVLSLTALTAERSALISAASKFCRMTLQIAVMGVGVSLVLVNELTPGAMIAGSIIMGRALMPVEQAIAGWKGWVSGFAAYRRLKAQLGDIVEQPPSVALPAPTGKLTADQVSYLAPGLDRPILRGISFRIDAGEAVGLIGPSGSGKSTLARLMVGVLAPATGRLQLDGADVAAWQDAGLGRHVGYLPQDVQLFAGTVRDNIARMTDAPGEMVLEAARMAGVHELIAGLPKGYDTVIGEGGVMLSGGQQQRIALARALFGDPPLVVLDEPDSNLDPDGHRALSAALDELYGRDRTLIIITHRPGILRHVDRLMLIRDGRLEDDGERDAVLARLQGEGQADPQRIARPTPRAVEG